MGPVTRFLVRALTWPLLPVLLAATRVDGVRLNDVPYLVAMLACWLVGVVLTARAFRQPAGWAFLGLGTVMAWSGCTEELALRTGDPLLAALADSSWVWWFVFVALALQLTVPGPRPRRLPAVTAGLGMVSQVLMLLRTRPLEPPFAGVRSPWAVPRLGTVLDAASYVVVVVLGLCVLASVYVLVRAWRRAHPEERRQLLWLVAGVLPLAPAVVAAFVLSYLGWNDLTIWPLAAAFVALAAGVAFSVLKYRLYDAGRVVSESAAYALASGAVVVVFGLVTLVITRTTPLGGTAQLPTVAATLAGVVVARQSYVWARRAVDRRLDRARFDAVETVRRGVRGGTPVDLDALIARALADPAARILYPSGTGWVTERGESVTPGADVVDVRGARLEFDPRRVDRDIVVAVAAEAAAEIDNVALRAELARQLAVVTRSRARLATAHQDERRRLERDLHDGAQQRILAIALQLQSARLNGADEMLRAEVDRAVVALGGTVQELRDLAAGMMPAALASGGLLAAVADMAERHPVPIGYDVKDRRFDPTVEGTAWFVIAEAVANAVKHADATSIRIEVGHDAKGLTVTVSDDGTGGADPDGRGLRGLHDRVEAAGGVLTVTDRAPSGTAVRAVLPCG
jgi:signal transduction histidine kinase